MARTQRLTVINPSVIAHVLDHPARGRKWPLRDLAPLLGISPAELGHIRSGHRKTVDVDLAHRIAEAVGVHVAVLFMTGESTESVDTQVAS